jgi:predicted TIM-barrel fold metal-dependent hydrolase
MVPSRPFVFSCDAHIAEPDDLFTKNMPAHLQQWAISSRKSADGKYRETFIGDTEILKVRVNFHTHKTGQTADALAEQEGQNQVSERQLAGSNPLAPSETRRRGARDLQLRAEDMDRDGVDAELVFPSLGLMLPRIANREGQREACKIYNDWAWEYCLGLSDRLVPVAMIPCLDFDDALAECRRSEQKGYAAFCLWEGMENYNDPRWDPIFQFAGEHNIPLVFHTGVGLSAIRALSGPGSAMFNYTRQMNDAVDIIGALVAGGVLDRHPSAHILFAEHSAGWLWGLAERMDEIYFGHAPAVHPKLIRLPSQIVKDQVHCALQNDIGALLTRHGVGIEALLWATDYPHSEGTFPFSRQVVEQMTEKYPDVTRDELVAVLGGNAAKLFPRANMKDRVQARAHALL